MALLHVVHARPSTCLVLSATCSLPGEVLLGRAWGKAPFSRPAKGLTPWADAAWLHAGPALHHGLLFLPCHLCSGWGQWGTFLRQRSQAMVGRLGLLPVTVGRSERMSRLGP